MFGMLLIILIILQLAFKLSGGIAYAVLKKPLSSYKSDFNEDFKTKATDTSKGYSRPALIRAGTTGIDLSKGPIHNRQIQGYESCRTYNKSGEAEDGGEYLKLYVGRPNEGYRRRVHKNDTSCSNGKLYNIFGMAIPGIYNSECLCEPKSGVDTSNMYKTFLPNNDSDSKYNKDMGGFKRFIKGTGFSGS